MDILPTGHIFRELQDIHDTGYFSAQPSLDDHWQQVQIIPRTIINWNPFINVIIGKACWSDLSAIINCFYAATTFLTPVVTYETKLRIQRRHLLQYQLDGTDVHRILSYVSPKPVSIAKISFFAVKFQMNEVRNAWRNVAMISFVLRSAKTGSKNR
ncbi:hypothetical protein WA026_014717 [Henosepilachna vigintioctopunctata]|uniref:Uncharacterized protein n=1 Tax=Henosepilachna vigintioctopunctata TaxID=420089 RepID=A0AAW1VCT8_9CUCU